MSKQDGVLYLVLREPWFSMIKSGKKKEEYRDLTPHYFMRFYDIKEKLTDNGEFIHPFNAIRKYSPMEFNYTNWAEQAAGEHFNKKYMVKFKQIHFVLGMPKSGEGNTEKHIVFKNPRIRIGEGKQEWGAEPGKRYFVITWEE